MNRTGLIAKISIKYVLPTCIWKYFWRILLYFAFLGEFRRISRKFLNFAGPRPREISEALSSIGKISSECNAWSYESYLPTLPVFPGISKFFIKSPGFLVRAPNLPRNTYRGLFTIFSLILLFLLTLPVFPGISKFFIKSPGLPVRAPNLLGNTYRGLFTIFSLILLFLLTLPVFPGISKFFIKSPGLPVRAPNLLGNT